VSEFIFGLVGNPNSGKTTVFNALTGARQRVGNWPGVTVERKEGLFEQDGHQCTVIDLPGVYSLIGQSESGAIDEAVAADYIRSGDADVIINIVDCAHLERHLYLTMQLLEMDVPVIVALNMVDVAKQRRIQVDAMALSAALGVPVVPIVASKGIGIDDLKRQCADAKSLKTTQKRKPCIFPPNIQSAISDLSTALTPYCQTKSDHYAQRLLEEDAVVTARYADKVAATLAAAKRQVLETEGEDADIIMADKRYQSIHQLCQQVVKRVGEKRQHATQWLDRIVLNRVLGIPIFFAVMYLMFLFAINVGGVFQDFVDISTQTIFVNGAAYLGHLLGLPVWLVAIVASGIGKGINTTLTFIPVIGGMFFFLSFLEGSGYMARAAFIMDRAMRAMGLPGKSFVPMIVGFGCNVPAVMGARTLDNPRDRILTIMMTPFMSCSARLAIFALFSTAFFPRGGQNVVFALYLIGIATAVLTGFVLRKSLLKGKPAPFIMELPAYHVPTWRTLWLSTWMRLRRFLLRAGKVIIPVCVLIGALNAITVHGTLNTGDASIDSLLSLVGRWLTPIFSPLGLHTENWPATVGLLTGTLAKEVVVATLNTLYTQAGHLAHAGHTGFAFWANMKAAVMSIPNNIAALPQALSNPILASAPDDTVNAGVYGVMYQQFGSQAAAFSYLVFVLLYVPCVATVAVIARELNRAWAIFSVVWGVALAYMVAVICYQSLTFNAHPETSLMWILGIATAFAVMVGALRLGAGRTNVIGYQTTFDDTAKRQPA
jgi:ferrous iron transport protein B